jgi:hypothetical protein
MQIDDIIKLNFDTSKSQNEMLINTEIFSRIGFLPSPFLDFM